MFWAEKCSWAIFILELTRIFALYPIWINFSIEVTVDTSMVPNVRRRFCWSVYHNCKKVIIFVEWFVERRADNLPTPRGELHQPLCSGWWQQHDRQHAVWSLLWGPSPHCLHHRLTHNQHRHWPLQHLRLPRTHERGPGEGHGQSSLPPQRGTQY